MDNKGNVKSIIRKLGLVILGIATIMATLSIGAIPAYADAGSISLYASSTSVPVGTSVSVYTSFQALAPGDTITINPGSLVYGVSYPSGEAEYASAVSYSATGQWFQAVIGETNGNQIGSNMVYIQWNAPPNPPLYMSASTYAPANSTVAVAIYAGTNGAGVQPGSTIQFVLPGNVLVVPGSAYCTGGDWCTEDVYNSSSASSNIYAEIIPGYGGGGYSYSGTITITWPDQYYCQYANQFATQNTTTDTVTVGGTIQLQLQPGPCTPPSSYIAIYEVASGCNTCVVMPGVSSQPAYPNTTDTFSLTESTPQTITVEGWLIAPNGTPLYCTSVFTLTWQSTPPLSLTANPTSLNINSGSTLTAYISSLPPGSGILFNVPSGISASGETCSGGTTCWITVSSSTAQSASFTAYTTPPTSGGNNVYSTTVSNSVYITWSVPQIIMAAPSISANPTSLNEGQTSVVTAVASGEPTGSAVVINVPAGVSGQGQNCSTSGSTITCTESFGSASAGSYSFSATAYPPSGTSSTPATSNSVTIYWTQVVVNAPTLSANPTSLNVGQSSTLTATGPSEPNGTSITMNLPSGVSGDTPIGCYTGTGGLMTCTENVVANTAGTYNFTATANLAGNMVPDSTLTYATYPNNPTWGTWSWGPGGITMGSGNGDFSISGGTLTYIGTGAQSPNGGFYSQTINVTPGATYSFSADMNATYVSNSSPYGPPGISIYDPVSYATYFEPVATPGQSGLVSGTWTDPAGLTQVMVTYYLKGAIVAAGEPLTWSNIQLTQTSAVQPYAPGAIAASSATSNSVSVTWNQPLTPPTVSASPTTQTVANSVTLTAVGTNEGSGVTIGFNNPANISQVSQSCSTSGSTITCTEAVTTTVAGTYDFSATAYPPPGVNATPEGSNMVTVTWNQPTAPGGMEFMPT